MSDPQIVLVTGATSGIGRATAMHLGRLGHHVFAAGRRVEQLESLARDADGLRLETVVLDVTKADSILAAQREIEARTGGHGVDALVNNAGYGLAGPLAELSDEEVRAQFETNVFGLLAVTRAFLPAMRVRGRGRVVNVSSVGGKITFPLMGAYNASKYAVEALSDALRVELAPLGIRVVLIEPGSIATPFTDASIVGLRRVPPGSPYRGVLDAATETNARFARTAVGPEHVARAIERAIVSRRPAARYVRPYRAYAFLLMARLLPTAWVDAMQGRTMGLTRARMIPPAPTSPPPPRAGRWYRTPVP
jgi:NAD(P)-dependent dehydrogenase (short-subunit alcohol dehydrogenase family)